MSGDASKMRNEPIEGVDEVYTIEHVRNGAWRLHVEMTFSSIYCVVEDKAKEIKRNFPDAELRIVKYSRLASREAAGPGPCCPRCGSDKFVNCENCGFQGDFAQFCDPEKAAREIAKHWVHAVQCDHRGMTDVVLCYCGWRSEPHAAVGLAIKEWSEHVAAILRSAKEGQE